MDGRAQAGRQYRGSGATIAAGEIRETSRIQSAHSLPSAELSLGACALKRLK
jgi:hypothetical protein